MLTIVPPSATHSFISPDTIIPDPSNPQSFNRYSYVMNNPINLVDPSGHSSQKAFTVGGGAGGKDSPPLMDPGLLGFNSSNTAPLVLEFYRNPYQFTGQAGVEYFVPGVSKAAEVATPLIGQGQIPDVPGVLMEGYIPTFAIHDWDKDGIPEWDRFVEVPGVGTVPVFQAEWEVRGGLAVETFALPGGVTAAVYLQPVVGRRDQLIFKSVAVEISKPVLGSSVSYLHLFSPGNEIIFTTRQTGPNTIQTQGQFYSNSTLVGQVTYDMVHRPESSSSSISKSIPFYTPP